MFRLNGTASTLRLRKRTAVRRSHSWVSASLEALEGRIVLDSTLSVGTGAVINSAQASEVVQYIIAEAGVYPTQNGVPPANQPFLGEVLAFGGNVAPRGWAFCDGQLLSIAQNPALFSIIGTTYGGNGTSNFALPNLEGRNPVGAGSAVGVTLGEQFGTANNTTLTTAEVPSNSASLSGGGRTGYVGGNQSISLQQPSLGINFIIATYGTFPSSSSGGATVPLLGEIRLFAGNFAPAGWQLCDGQLLSISANVVLFSIIGSTYGGDGIRTFALPNLEGRTPVGVGTAPGVGPITLGEPLGSSTTILNIGQLPAFSYPLPPSGAQSTSIVGGGLPYENQEPALGLNYLITIDGNYPSPDSGGGIEPLIGDIRLFAGNFAPQGFLLCQGQALPISGYETLYNLIGTIYGGNASTYFMLPNFSGRESVEAGQVPGGGQVTNGNVYGSSLIYLTKAELPELSVALPVLAVTAAADSNTVNAGSTAGFNFSISNTGAAGTAAALVTLSVPLPALGGGNLWSINSSPVTGPTHFTITGPAGSQVLAIDPNAYFAGGGTLTVDVIGVPAPTGSPSAQLTATATADSPDVTVRNITATASFTVLSQQPTFSGLSSASISYGTPTTTFTGTLAVLGVAVPNANVAVTINSVVQTVMTDTSGFFSTTFNTATLGALGSPYAVQYAFAGNTTDNPATDTSTSLTVNKAHLTVTALLTNSDIGHGNTVPTPTVRFSGFVNGDSPTVVSGSPTFLGLPTTSSPAGIYTITPSTTGLSAANYDFPNVVSATLSVHPQVEDILVKWGSQSMSILNLTRDLPFVDITGLEVKFTDPVNITGTGLSLTSTVGGPAYAPANLGANTGTSDVTWKLPTAIGVDRLLLQLDQNGIAATAGSTLALFGLAQKSFSVLPGDVNGDGVVSSLDMATVQGQILGVITPTIWADVDGSGKVDLTDYNDVRKWLGSKLP